VQEATKYYREYWKLKWLRILNSVCKQTNGKLGRLWNIQAANKTKGITIYQVTNAVEIAIHKLSYMEDLYKHVTHEVYNLQHIRQELINHIEALKTNYQY
jgi:hypothetical protein